MLGRRSLSDLVFAGQLGAVGVLVACGGSDVEAPRDAGPADTIALEVAQDGIDGAPAETQDVAVDADAGEAETGPWTAADGGGSLDGGKPLPEAGYDVPACPPGEDC